VKEELSGKEAMKKLTEYFEEAPRDKVAALAAALMLNQAKIWVVMQRVTLNDDERHLADMVRLNAKQVENFLFRGAMHPLNIFNVKTGEAHE
jgi:hypothetical protein